LPPKMLHWGQWGKKLGEESWEKVPCTAAIVYQLCSKRIQKQGVLI
jgi:hypothetical protein